MNRIKEIREKHGITAQTLAHKVGASWGQLFQLENGLRALDEYWAARIAEALGCFPHDLTNKVRTIPSVGIPVVRLPHAQDIELPVYATEQSAGVDLVAAIDKEEVIAPGARALIATGIAMQLPAGYEAQVRPRSGLALKNGITVLNSPGTIDADYRGEIKVILINHGQEPFTITRGSRIAQLVVAPVSRLAWHPTESLESSERAEGGFGSTGVAAPKVKASA